MKPREIQLSTSATLLSVKGRSFFMSPGERQQWKGINVVVDLGYDEPRIFRLLGSCGDIVYGYGIESPVWDGPWVFYHHQITQVIPWY